MPSYEYKALTSSGKVIEEVIESPNKERVAKEIFKKGYKPVSIKVVKVDAQKKGGELQLFTKKVNIDQIVLFTRQLVTLLRAGVHLLTSLEALGSQSNTEMKEVLNKVYVSVMSGKSLSQALADHPKVFSQLYVNSVYAGEMSGNLDEVLERLVTVIQHDAETKKKVKSAVKMPMFVLSFMILAMYILLTQVVPKFGDMFASMNMQLPFFTRLLIGVSDFFVHYGIFLLGGIVVGVISFSVYIKTEQGRLRWDEAKMKIPVVGDLINKSVMTRFTKMFETLNKSGLPIIQTLQTVSQAVGNAAVEQSIKKVALGVEKGQGISGSMKRINLFPPLVMRMISIGEQSGSLDEMLSSIAQHYDMEVEYAIKSLTSLIEPILTVLIGGMVMVLALGIFMPMWGMVGALQ
ncbi:MAG: type II secretion system F family protein [bacterium]